MKLKADEIIKGAEALELAMAHIPTKPCPCLFVELLEDCNESEINTIIKYQSRICSMLAAATPGGDVRANNYLIHLLERRKQLESKDIFNDEILEEK